MIDYLRESTFAVNDVIHKAWTITRKHYLSIATLCFLMFITSMASTIMSGLLREVDFFLSLFMLLVFVLLYFTLNLTLFRYVFHLLDDEKDDVLIVQTIPTKVQIVTFLIASVVFVFTLLIIMLLTAFLPFALFYILLKIRLFSVDQKVFSSISNVFLLIGFLSAFIAFVRLSFFPFFIIDRKTDRLTFQEISFSKTTGNFFRRITSTVSALFTHALLSIKFSLALTKGNFTKLLLLLAVLATFGYLYGYLRDNDVLIPGKIYLIILTLSFISFIIVPLTAVSLTVAYRKMMDEYEGEANPTILHNLV
ncbi:hypothetical protein ABIB40_000137 [Pedobacter sp. UYP30]|uniref:hypothetical protein n=1 Tax=Pedobacter sp. UYP30 TaxID=1756400 RepID=UPI0033991624